uniref:Disease resistance protein RPS5 n=1 Tax=Rhizophora mucronata TaxID=61149 RepID=A0A2P2MMI9_RHIMU
MALELFIPAIVQTVLEYTIGPVIRHAGYAFRYAKKLTELKNKVEEVRVIRQSLQNSVTEAERGGDEIQPIVQKWLTDAEKAIQKAGELTEGEEEEAKKRCFAGGCPNLKTRYQLGKKAAKEALAIQDLENKGNFDSTQISYRAPARQIISSSVHGFEGFPSRVSIFQEVMDALSDPNVNMIGVYGMPGAGKTTLAREVHKQAREGNLFDVVAIVTVSVKPELEKIQDSIAGVLGLKLEEKTADVRANRIHQRMLKEKRALIILDDLWENFELENLGIPLTNEKIGNSSPEVEQRKNYIMGCKLLLTSRNRDLIWERRKSLSFKIYQLRRHALYS